MKLRAAGLGSFRVKTVLIKKRTRPLVEAQAAGSCYTLESKGLAIRLLAPGSHRARDCRRTGKDLELRGHGVHVLRRRHRVPSSECPAVEER